MIWCDPAAVVVRDYGRRVATGNIVLIISFWHLEELVTILMVMPAPIDGPNWATLDRKDRLRPLGTDQSATTDHVGF